MISLQTRLGSGLLVSLMLVFLMLGLLISNAIRTLAEEQMMSRLQHDMEILLSSIRFDQDQIQLDSSQLHPSFQQPFSGHYYLISRNNEKQQSRSLWDFELAINTSALGDTIAQHLPGPQQQPLLVVTSTYKKQGRLIQLSVAEDLTRLEAGVQQFQQRFVIIALVSLILLVVLQIIIMRTSLKPIERVRDQLQALSHGELQTLDQQVPAEISPLVNSINHLLTMLSQRLQRSRHALGDLAHALKTPLTRLNQISADNSQNDPVTIAEALKSQTAIMQQLIERQLNRARLAGHAMAGRYFETRPDSKALIDAMKQIYADKSLRIESQLPNTAFIAVDREDLYELLGNLLDNACKWAKSRVHLSIEHNTDITIRIEDDGPGVNREKMDQLLLRGQRLDETVEGHGLGLAIVQDMVADYHGTIELGQSAQLGGLQVTVTLPLTTEE